MRWLVVLLTFAACDGREQPEVARGGVASPHPSTPHSATEPNTHQVPAAQSQAPAPIAGVGGPKVTYASRKRKRPPYNTYVTYPVLTYGKQTVVAKAANARIRGFAEKWLIAFDEDFHRDPTTSAYVSVACSVSYASATLVSVGCDYYMYAGGAHGTKGHEALNLQIPMLREIRIEDLVRTDPDAHQKLITLCDSALRASPTDGDDKIVSMGDAFGSGADIRFKTFLIRQSGLTFTFKSELPHVIADVVAPHVTWAALGPLMHDRGRAMVPGPSEPFTEAEAPWGPWDARAEEDGLAEVPAE